jgi:hypothetical protein
MPAFKNTFFAGSSHHVEILWNGDLARHETQSTHLRRGRIINRGDFDERLTGLGDNERFALGSPIDQP